MTRQALLESNDSEDRLLLCRAGSRLCGLPLAHAIETMRPLPLERVAGMPEFMAGISLVRGAPLPVIHLAALLGDTRIEEQTRFVSLKVGERTIVLSVDSVLGIRRLRDTAIAALPLLLQQASTAFISAIGTLDAALLVVLETARLVPDAVWAALQTADTHARDVPA